MILLLLLLALCQPEKPNQLRYKIEGRAEWAIKDQGATTVRTRIGRESLVVTVRTWRIPANTVHWPPQCTSHRLCSITEQLTVSLGGHDLWIGPYQFVDLADPHYISFAGTPRRPVVIISGSDAAESYDAHFIFNRQHVIERDLYAGEDPSHPFEVSHYYYSVIP